MREGYREGKFGYLDLLDAQRSLFDAKGQYIDALAGYHKSVAAIERLIGESLSSIKNNVKQNEKELVNDEKLKQHHTFSCIRSSSIHCCCGYQIFQISGQ